MVLETFYKRLAKVKDNFGWEINSKGCIRGRDSRNNKVYCPIQAVFVKDKFLPAYQLASRLDYMDHNCIMWAADNVLTFSETIKIRNRMLKIVGLNK